jgi:hypothetical protein
MISARGAEPPPSGSAKLASATCVDGAIAAGADTTGSVFAGEGPVVRAAPE